MEKYYPTLFNTRGKSRQKSPRCGREAERVMMKGTILFVFFNMTDNLSV